MARATNISVSDGLLALAIIAGWSFNIVIIRAGALEVPPLFLLLLRFILGAVIFLPFVRRIDMRTFRNLAAYTILYVVCHLGFLYLGALYVSASLVGLLIQMGTPFALLLGFIFFQERFGLKTGAGIVLAFAGIVLIMYQPVGDFSVPGALCILFSAFCWAAGSMRMREVEHVDLGTMTVVSYVLAAPLVGGLSFLIEENQVQALIESNHIRIGLILAYQVFVMSASLYWWKGLMSRNPVHQLTAFLVLQPLFVVLFGFFMLGETLNAREMLGGLVLLSGVGIITFRRIKKARPA